jgi:predicted metal-dependent phosphoesterase TrpH
MLLDLHIHSKYSYDSFAGLDSIVKTAKKKGIRAISITDHNTMAAYKNLKNISKSDEIFIIRGMEVKTELGDITGLFLQNEIKSRNFDDVIDEIREQSGISVLPHPYRRKCDPEDLVSKIDLIEIFNARSTKEENTMAQKLCNATKKVAITGSDAHLCFEIGRAVTQINSDADDEESLRKIVLNSERQCSGSITPYIISHGCSYMAARLKRWKK